MSEFDPAMLPGALSSTASMAVSPNGLYLACLTRRNSVMIWDVARRVVLARHFDVQGSALAWLSDTALLLGGYDGVDELEALTGEQARWWEGVGFGFVNQIVVADAGTVAITGSESVAIVEDGVCVATLGPWPDPRGWNATPRGIDRHPGGEAFAVFFDDHGRVVDRNGEELAWFDGARAMRFSHDGAKLLTIGYSEASLYDWPGLQAERPLAFHLDDASPVGSGWLGWDHSAAVRFGVDGEEVWNTRFYDGLQAVAVRGSRFYTASQQQWIGVRDVEGGGELLTILPAGAGQPIRAMGFDDDGRRIVAADESGRVTVWDFDDARATAMIDTSALQEDNAALEVAALRHVDALWVTRGALHIVSDTHYVWPDLGDPELGSQSPLTNDDYLGVVCADRRHALVQDYDAEATFLVRLEDGARVAVLPPHDRYEERVVIECGASRLLFMDVAGEGTTLRVWDVERACYEQELHVDVPVTHVAFEPGGAVVGWLSTDAVFDWDNADDDVECAPAVFFRWEPETGDVMRWIDAPNALAEHCDVLFGRDLAVFGEGGTAMKLDLRTQDLVELTTTRATCAALHAETGRIAVATEHGIVALIDGERRTLVCTTADGSTWSMRRGQLDLHHSRWAAP